jgi:hypothetical protein
MYFVLHVWCDVNFPFILYLFVLWRVEEPMTEDPGDQQIEVPECDTRFAKKRSWSLSFFCCFCFFPFG